MDSENVQSKEQQDEYIPLAMTSSSSVLLQLWVSRIFMTLQKGLHQATLYAVFFIDHSKNATLTYACKLYVAYLTVFCCAAI
jgi:hypothetical protein